MSVCESRNGAVMLFAGLFGKTDSKPEVSVIDDMCYNIPDFVESDLGVTQN